MKRILLWVVMMLVGAVVVAAASTQPIGKPTTEPAKSKPAPAEQKAPASPYDRALAPVHRRVPMVCNNHACNDPETCGIFTQGRTCTTDPVFGCEEMAC